MSRIQLKLPDLTQMNVSQAVQDLLLDNTVKSAHELVNNDPKKLKIAYINEVADLYSKQVHLSKNKAKEALKKMSEAELEKLYRNVHMYDHNTLLPMTVKDHNGEFKPWFIIAKADGRKLDPAQSIADDAVRYCRDDGHFIIEQGKDKDGNRLPPIDGQKYVDTAVGILKGAGYHPKTGEPLFYVASIDLDITKLESAK